MINDVPPKKNGLTRWRSAAIIYMPQASSDNGGRDARPLHPFNRHQRKIVPLRRLAGETLHAVDDRIVDLNTPHPVRNTLK